MGCPTCIQQDNANKEDKLAAYKIKAITEAKEKGHQAIAILKINDHIYWVPENDPRRDRARAGTNGLKELDLLLID